MQSSYQLLACKDEFNPPGVYISKIKRKLSQKALKYSVCRMCATYHAKIMLVRLFEPPRPECPKSESLADIINKFLPIKVVEDDQLPVVVCNNCAEKLMAWQETVQMAVDSARILKGQSELANHTISVHNIYKSATPSPLGGDDSLRDSDSDSDCAPLARLAARDPLQALRRALRDLRDHYSRRHGLRAATAPAEGSEPEPDRVTPDPDPDPDQDQDPDPDPDRFDDLTRGNMRLERVDEATRREAAAARVLVDGRVLYACGVCGRHVASPHALVHHARIHTGARPCVCHVCGKRFRAPQGLARHLAETHERRGRRACRLCAGTFANAQNLRQHMRTHTGERPHECPHCGKRFAQAGSLHAHRRTHGDRRAFRCADCGAAFKTRAGLARHALRHVRPHRCECGRAFAQRGELRAHAALHGDATPHACDACGAAYKMRRALRDHVRRAHPPSLTRASAFPGTAE